MIRDPSAVLASRRSKGDFGALPLDIPSNREGTFAQQIALKQQTHWTCFDDKVISLYALGLSAREIQSRSRRCMVSSDFLR